MTKSAKIQLDKIQLAMFNVLIEGNCLSYYLDVDEYSNSGLLEVNEANLTEMQKLLEKHSDLWEYFEEAGRNAFGWKK